MVVDASIHQVPDHQVVLYGHEALWMNRHFPIGGQSDGGQNPFQIQLAIAGARAVAVAQQIVEPVAIQLAAHERLDHTAFGAAMLQQVGHGIRCSCRKRLQRRSDLRMVANDSRGPLLVVRAEHLLAGVAEGGMAEIMQQCGCVEHTLFGFERRVEFDQPAHGAACDGENPKRVCEPTGLCAVEGEKCWSELTDAAKSLKRG